MFLCQLNDLKYKNTITFTLSLETRNNYTTNISLLLSQENGAVETFVILFYDFAKAALFPIKRLISVYKCEQTKTVQWFDIM